jgi:molecular chaperone DnaJ
VSPCSPCDGLGNVKTQTPFRVTFPSGTPEGHRTIVTGEGEKGLAGGRHGDLIFVACLDPSSGFQRAGMDLLMDVEFNHQKTNIHIDHPEGPVEVTVPNDGAVDVIIVKGYGLPSVQDSQTRGDIRVQLKQKTDS